MSEVPPHILEWRRHTGADRFDEVWDGVLHMVPSPANEHQRVQAGLYAWLVRHWVQAPARDALMQVNVSRPGIRDWTKDYRVPDLVLMTPEGDTVDRRTHFEGGPDVVVEIRSPGDETYDKLPFYAAIGCREVWIVDGETRASEIYAVEADEPRRRRAEPDGWTRSALGIELRTDAQRLVLRRTGDDESVGRVP